MGRQEHEAVGRVFVMAGQVRGFLHTLSLKAFTDSDYAGCLRTARSTSGWCVFLVGATGAFSTILLDWGSKRQQVVAKSTTEAETVANNEMLTRCLIPLGGVFAQLNSGDPIREDAVTDSEASRLAIAQGASNAMRYLHTHQRVSLMFLKDAYGEEHR